MNPAQIHSKLLKIFSTYCSHSCMMNLKTIKIWDEAKPSRLAVAFLAEFVGTCLFVFVACAFVFVTATLPSNEATLVAARTHAVKTENSTTALQNDIIYSDDLMRNSLAMGAILSGVVLLIHPFSGAHINPAVSAAFLLLGKMSVVRTVGYVVSQCLGAIAASALLSGAFSSAPGGKDQFACSLPAPFITDFPASIVEACSTFVLVFTILAIFHVIELSGKPANRPPPLLLLVALFVTVTTTVYIAAPFTGASMNPARSFGPAIVWGCWNHHHVYWFGPMIGSLFASAVFYIFTSNHENDAGHVDEESTDADLEMQPLIQN